MEKNFIYEDAKLQNIFPFNLIASENFTFFLLLFGEPLKEN